MREEIDVPFKAPYKSITGALIDLILEPKKQLQYYVSFLNFQFGNKNRQHSPGIGESLSAALETKIL